MPFIVIPAALRRLMSEPVSTLEVDAATAREALDGLIAKYPELRETFLDSDGNLRQFVRIFIGEEDIESLQGQDTPVTPSDEIVLLPPIAGG